MHIDPVEQALAIARRAAGGATSTMPAFVRQAMRSISSPPPASTQISPVLPASQFILPADVVAGLGAGNSMYGARVFNEAVRTMPWGVDLPAQRGTRGPPSPPQDASLLPRDIDPLRTATALSNSVNAQTLADGGGVAEHALERDGTVIVRPDTVLRIGQYFARPSELHDGGALRRRGHAVLNALVREVRRRVGAAADIRNAPIEKQSADLADRAERMRKDVVRGFPRR